MFGGCARCHPSQRFRVIPHAQHLVHHLQESQRVFPATQTPLPPHDSLVVQAPPQSMNALSPPVTSFGARRTNTPRTSPTRTSVDSCAACSTHGRSCVLTHMLGADTSACSQTCDKTAPRPRCPLLTDLRSPHAHDVHVATFKEYISRERDLVI